MNVLKQKIGKLPEAKVFVYRMNPATGYYDRQGEYIPFTKVPIELKVEETRRPEQIASKIICRGKEKEGKRYVFFTGLIPIGSGGLYFGDHYEFIKEKKVNSFILFQFSEQFQVITIHFFNRFKLYPKRRVEFVSQYFNSINR